MRKLSDDLRPFLVALALSAAGMWLLVPISIAAQVPGEAEGVKPDSFRNPTKLTGPVPAYPPDMREKHLGGGCVLLITVDSKGRVSMVRPIKSSPDGESFLEAAIGAACQWQYSPARFHGVAVSYEVSANFEFSMGDGEGETVNLADLRPLPEPTKFRSCDPNVIIPDGSRPSEEHEDVWIDVSSGGPAPFLVGNVIHSFADLEAILPGLEWRPVSVDRVRVLWPSTGIEGIMEFVEKEKAFRVISIQYAFREGLGLGAPASVRTLEGLGFGSSCKDVLRALGSPESISTNPVDAVSPPSAFRYRFGESAADFHCADGALELIRLHWRE